MIIHLILEGYLEEPVADKLLEISGHQKGTVYGRQGFGYISTKAHAFEALTRSGCGVLVLTDFRDSGAECPPMAVKKYLLCHKPNPSPSFLLRFAEAELESWLLADREAMACFLGVPLKKVPCEPDKESHPKRALVNIARKSRKARIKNGLIPPKNSCRAFGPAYLSLMTGFINDFWRPLEAAKSSSSLNSCIARLQGLEKKIDDGTTS